MSKHPFTLLFLCAAAIPGFSQRQMVSLAYEGGMVTHPGLSAAYLAPIATRNGWVLQGGIKVGFYYHRRYQTGIFLTPVIQGQHVSTKGFIWGVDMAAGPQRTFIPNTYKVDDSGSISKHRSAGMMQWVFTPGIRFGRDLSERRMVPLQWFLNPQLQFRRPATGRMEKYFLMGVGINYKL